MFKSDKVHICNSSDDPTTVFLNHKKLYRFSWRILCSISSFCLQKRLHRYFKVYISKSLKKCLPFIKMTWEFFMFSIGLNKQQTEFNFPRLFSVLFRIEGAELWADESMHITKDQLTHTLYLFLWFWIDYNLWWCVCAVCICGSFIVSIVMFFS